MTGQFEVQVSEADLLAAYRAHYPLFPKVRIAVGALFVLLFGVGIALLDKPGDAQFAAVFAGTLLLLMAILLVAIQLVMRLWWMPRYSRRIYAQQVDLRTAFTISWDEERLSTVSAIGSGITAWRDFHRWLRTNDLLLIYRSDALFHIVPLRDSEAQRAADTIVARLEEAGVPRKRTT